MKQFSSESNAYMADLTRFAKLSNPDYAIQAPISKQLRAEVCKLEHCATNFCILQNVLHACSMKLAKMHMLMSKRWKTVLAA